MIKAMFFDVDGTLVSFNTHRIPESTIQALQEAHDRGVKIFTATGRPCQLLNNIREVEPIMDGYILATGALCTYGDHIVREDLIPFDEAHAVVDFCNERNLPAVVVGKEDIQIIKSPVGMPGRAIFSKFIQKVKEGQKQPKTCICKCIKTCDISKSPYCIIAALYNAFKGNMDNGYAFAGANAFRATKIVSVKETFRSLLDEFSRSGK